MNMVEKRRLALHLSIVERLVFLRSELKKAIPRRWLFQNTFSARDLRRYGLPATLEIKKSAQNSLISRTKRFFAALHLSAYQSLHRGFLKCTAESWIKTGTIVLHADNVFCISVNHDRGRMQHDDKLPAFLVRHNGGDHTHAKHQTVQVIFWLIQQEWIGAIR